MSLTWDASVPPFPYTASFTANWQTQPIQHFVVKLSLSPGTYQISVLPDLMVLTTAAGATTPDDVTEFLPEVMITSASVLRTVNWWDSDGRYHTDESQVASLVSSPDTLATQAIQGAGIFANYGEFSYHTATVSIEPERTINYPSGARDVYTDDYYLSIDGWNLSYPHQPSGTEVPLSGRFLITSGNPTGQRTDAWGGDWLNVQSWFEFYQPPIVPPVTPPGGDLDPVNLPATISFTQLPDAHGVETPHIADSPGADWWRDFGATVLSGYSSQALGALKQLADAAGHFKVGAALDVVNAATTAASVRDFLNGFVAKVWAHDAEGIQLVLNPNTTAAQMYEWGARGHQLNESGQRGSWDQAWSIILDHVLPGGGTVNSVYSSVPQKATERGSFSLGLLIPGLQVNGSDKSDVVSGGSEADDMQLGAGNDAAMGFGGNDVISVGDGRDWLWGGAGDDLLDGGSGADSAVYLSSRSGYAISGTGNGWAVVDLSGVEGRDSLVNVERLKFADKWVALDIAGNAGKVAKILGAVFGPAYVSNQEYVGIGLSYLDSSMSYEDLCALAVTAAGKTSPSSVVELLWSNVVGSPISAENKAYYVDLLDKGMSVGALTALAADTDLNVLNIGLVGLAQTGLAYW